MLLREGKGDTLYFSPLFVDITSVFSLIGIGEIVLLPLDALKIKMQLNPKSLEGKGLGQILYQEGWGLYR
jgi:hypothetical protein